MTDWLSPPRPHAIAHRGASAYAPDCSLAAYEKAARLGADMWEVDIRSAACGTLITYHDAALPDGQQIATLTADQIAAEAQAQGVPAVPFDQVLALAVRQDAGIYADIKDTQATLPVLDALRSHGITRAILGAFDPEAAAQLAAADCPYPRAVLVPLGGDPFAYAQGADVIHLCWEHMDRPQDALTPAFFAEAEKRGQKVVLWHEEDPARMAELRHLPVLGICSDRPELVHPFTPPADWPVQIACHRGACEFAPENTLAGAHCAFAAGFDYVEIDVQDTSDGDLLVFHDEGLSRTSTGRGAITWQAREPLRTLDAGSHFEPFFADQKIPTLAEMLDVARLYNGQLYVELKHADPARVIAAVTAAKMLERCFFWSYDRNRLQALRAASPQARIMLRRQDIPTLETAQAWDAQIIEYDLRDDLSELPRCRALGLRSMIAYMGRAEPSFDQLIAARPDMLNLHFPFHFRAHLMRSITTS